MKKRQIQYSCADDACKQLAKVLSRYAHAAFPVGGSECAQATRESLLDLAKRMTDCTEAKFAINARQRPMLKSAIEWYFSEELDDTILRGSLLAGLNKKR